MVVKTGAKAQRHQNIDQLTNQTKHNPRKKHRYVTGVHVVSLGGGLRRFCTKTTVQKQLYVYSVTAQPTFHSLSKHNAAIAVVTDIQRRLRLKRNQRVSWCTDNRPTE